MNHEVHSHLSSAKITAFFSVETHRMEGPIADPFQQALPKHPSSVGPATYSSCVMHAC